MGLDMYLNRKVYVRNWNHDSKEKQLKVSVTQNGKAWPQVRPAFVKYIEEEAAIWRKANHIHTWFVQEVQDGEDDCKEYYVSQEKLRELVAVCKQVLAASVLVDGDIENGKQCIDGKWTPITQAGQYIKDSTVAASLLPTHDGFFFGSTAYDQYYYQDLVYTVEALEKCLAIPDDTGDYYYQSSW